MTERDDMQCVRFFDLLPRFIENDFSPEEWEEVHAHIAGCAHCRAEYEAMRSLVDTLDALPSLDVPASFKEAVMRHLPPKPDEP